MAKYTLINFPSEETFLEHAVEDFRALATDAIAKRGAFRVALSGGNTPKPFYKALSEAQIDWSKIHIYVSDERYVPLSDPTSNFGSIERSLISHIQIPKSNLHPVLTGCVDPHEAARLYELELSKVKLDLVYLGIGADGHTASLFPGLLIPTTHKVAAFYVPKMASYRISMVPDLINESENIRFLVSGPGKKHILDYILTQGDVPHKYPCQFIKGCEIFGLGI